MNFEVRKIWNHALHNALTDLIYFNHNWYCTFRESDKHVHGQDGKIRIIKSQTGEVWESIALIEEEGIDLRDPKLSITPGQELMLLMGGTQYDQKKVYIERQPRVAFSRNGKTWSPLHKILEAHEWLWRVTWFKDFAYGASYSFVDPKDPKGEWKMTLFKSSNGVDYSLVKKWEIPGKPNETTLRFFKDGTMVALVRREQKINPVAWIGHSSPPYTFWEWKPTTHHLGGPNFLIFPNGTMWASGRLIDQTPYGIFEKTVLASMTLEDIHPKYYLPSGGEDCSYPGMVYKEGGLWISYYSSHEGRCAIYLAKGDLK